MTLYPELNNQQRAAVTADDGPVLVLAGPGSGKTRVLTYRIAHLINQRKIPAYSIIAVTFTNKAAGEMKERVQKLIGKDAIRGLRIGTFHALCARLLRREASDGNLEPYNGNYLIYDTDDQKSVVKRVVEELGVDLKRLRLTPYKALTMISDAKNELVAPSQYPRTEYLDEVIARIYERYQEILRESNAMDFDDLIMNTVLLLRNNVEVRNRYQRYYEYVLVDEFQDTNMAQYELVRLWCAPQNNVFVVGDEDQAIYGFRGADYRNVMRFRDDYKSATTLLLEQNYRSTQVVLDAARAVIDQNRDRTPKALFTDRTDDAKIYAYEAYDEREEAEFIVKEIMRLKAAGKSLKDIAIMYRTNVQSRAMEQALVDARIPYQLIGGVAFYQRREVKDMLAYLRLVDSGADSVGFGRIINTPRRGIGAKTQGNFQAWADANGYTYGEALLKLTEGEQVDDLGAASNRKLAKFGEQLIEWRKQAEAGQYADLLEDVVQNTEYLAHLASISKTDDELNERQDNINELKGLLAEADFESLSEFLTDTTLSTDLDRSDGEADRVTMLTLHASKGLEYAVVFLTGLEDGLLPHSRSFDEPDGMAEERRLLYVGITRAKDRLYITRAFRRRMGQYAEPSEASRFLFDIPPHLIEGSSVSTKAEQVFSSYYRSTAWDAVPPGARVEGARKARQKDEKIIPFPGADVNQFKVGGRVFHAKFGAGVVIESKINGNDEEVTVAFEEAGIKRLMASFANLQKLDG
ncbi:MAG: UvrD-helicase domain-containing protein [Chloroflexota bacterium]